MVFDAIELVSVYDWLDEFAPDETFDFFVVGFVSSLVHSQPFKPLVLIVRGRTVGETDFSSYPMPQYLID